jgi:hypothetical protein
LSIIQALACRIICSIFLFFACLTSPIHGNLKKRRGFALPCPLLTEAERMPWKRLKIIAWITVTADGYIACAEGSVDWLERPPPHGNYGWNAFLRGIDAILWGRKTYEQDLAWTGLSATKVSTAATIIESERPVMLLPWSRLGASSHTPKSRAYSRLPSVGSPVRAFRVGMQRRPIEA